MLRKAQLVTQIQALIGPRSAEKPAPLAFCGYCADRLGPESGHPDARYEYRSRESGLMQFVPLLAISSIDNQFL
jgi:hypothetical protein